MPEENLDKVYATLLAEWRLPRSTTLQQQMEEVPPLYTVFPATLLILLHLCEMLPVLMEKMICKWLCVPGASLL